LALVIILEVIKSNSLPVSVNNIMRLYNFVALSDKVKEMAIPIAYKHSKKIVGKLSHINSKHGSFQSLIDSFNDEK
jgi:hypothetical protein